ncbi:MAG TPA: ribonuclease P protein component [Stenomitos sp.]
MLPQHHRLKNRRDFDSVYRNGIRCNAAALGLRAYQPPQSSQQLAPSRIGISISQKVSKRAVVRNRIKRQVRAAVRQLLPDLDAGWDLVFVVYPSALECGYWEFLQQLKQLLGQVRIFHGD